MEFPNQAGKIVQIAFVLQLLLQKKKLYASTFLYKSISFISFKWLIAIYNLEKIANSI